MTLLRNFVGAICRVSREEMRLRNATKCKIKRFSNRDAKTELVHLVGPTPLCSVINRYVSAYTGNSGEIDETVRSSGTVVLRHCPS